MDSGKQTGHVTTMTPSWVSRSDPTNEPLAQRTRLPWQGPRDEPLRLQVLRRPLRPRAHLQRAVVAEPKAVAAPRVDVQLGRGRVRRLESEKVKDGILWLYRVVFRLDEERARRLARGAHAERAVAPGVAVVVVRRLVPDDAPRVQQHRERRPSAQIVSIVDPRIAPARPVVGEVRGEVRAGAEPEDTKLDTSRRLATHYADRALQVHELGFAECKPRPERHPVLEDVRRYV
mmetsp:Transcript_20030/g.40830  ORF Transcript_20030/g.40830 Transcript_20030/m.40830 type:complete len:232 (-) Transcript_20030:311-1006(-)